MLKNRNESKGAKDNCINFELCPLCYGCRNFNNSYLKCQKCKEDNENNICKTNKHKTKLVAKMIKKQCVEIKNND